MRRIGSGSEWHSGSEDIPSAEDGVFPTRVTAQSTPKRRATLHEGGWETQRVGATGTTTQGLDKWSGGLGYASPIQRGTPASPGQGGGGGNHTFARSKKSIIMTPRKSYRHRSMDSSFGAMGLFHAYCGIRKRLLLQSFTRWKIVAEVLGHVSVSEEGSKKLMMEARFKARAAEHKIKALENQIALIHTDKYQREVVALKAQHHVKAELNNALNRAEAAEAIVAQMEGRFMGYGPERDKQRGQVKDPSSRSVGTNVTSRAPCNQMKTSTHQRNQQTVRAGGDSCDEDDLPPPPPDESPDCSPPTSPPSSPVTFPRHGPSVVVGQDGVNCSGGEDTCRESSRVAGVYDSSGSGGVPSTLQRITHGSTSLHGILRTYQKIATCRRFYQWVQYLRLDAEVPSPDIEECSTEKETLEEARRKYQALKKQSLAYRDQVKAHWAKTEAYMGKLKEMLGTEREKSRTIHATHDSLEAQVHSLRSQLEASQASYDDLKRQRAVLPLESPVSTPILRHKGLSDVATHALSYSVGSSPVSSRPSSLSRTSRGQPQEVSRSGSNSDLMVTTTPLATPEGHGEITSPMRDGKGSAESTPPKYLQEQRVVSTRGDPMWDTSGNSSNATVLPYKPPESFVSEGEVAVVPPGVGESIVPTVQTDTVESVTKSTFHPDKASDVNTVHYSDMSEVGDINERDVVGSRSDILDDIHEVIHEHKVPMGAVTNAETLDTPAASIAVNDYDTSFVEAEVAAYGTDRTASYEYDSYACQQWEALYAESQQQLAAEITQKEETWRNYEYLLQQVRDLQEARAEEQKLYDALVTLFSESTASSVHATSVVEADLPKSPSLGGRRLSRRRLSIGSFNRSDSYVVPPAHQHSSGLSSGVKKNAALPVLLADDLLSSTATEKGRAIVISSNLKRMFSSASTEVDDASLDDFDLAMPQLPEIDISAIDVMSRTPGGNGVDSTIVNPAIEAAMTAKIKSTKRRESISGSGVPSSEGSSSRTHTQFQVGEATSDDHLSAVWSHVQSADCASGGTNVRVAIRMRPLNAREVEMQSPVCVHMQAGTEVIVEDVDATQEHRYNFDYCFDANANDDDASAGSQLITFQKLGVEVLTNAWHGYNASLFAYGVY